MMRRALLVASNSTWMRERATRYPFVRRAVRRFMPGETLDEALAAARELQTRGLASITTWLGENVEDESRAAGVAAHYVGALDRIADSAVDAEISVKLTHLGLDLGEEVARRNVTMIARAAQQAGRRVWIDMEGSAYTEATLGLYRKLAPAYRCLGVCLQAYLRRTPADLESLLPLKPAIRLVKGAYREPPALAFPRKADVDEAWMRLAVRLLGASSGDAGVWTVFGTHDPRLIRKVEDHAAARRIARDRFEFDLLYGIRRDEQERLARAGYRVRVLISYGSYWYPWYMRRLAERPANLWFVARSMLRA